MVAVPIFREVCLKFLVIIEEQKIVSVPIFILICLSIVSFSRNAEAIKILPLVDASAGMAGSCLSYRDTSSRGIGADIYLDFTPALRITDEIDILPRFTLRYQGSRRLAELIGGGSLFQQAIDGNASVKYIQRIAEDLKIKLSGGFNKEWLQETKDEPWGLGLYDYNKSGAGIEIEKGGLRTGYNFYIMRFPNYWTLASAAETFGLETTGKYVLDYNANEIYFSGRDMASEEIMYKYGYTYTRLDYPEQKLINQNAEYISLNRYDNIHNVMFGLTRFFQEKLLDSTSFKPSLSLSYSLTYNQSNQNHYDVEKFQYIPNFYDYLQHKLSLSCNLHFFPSEMDMIFQYVYSNRVYLFRPAQDADGNYGVDMMNLQSSYITGYINYPVWDYCSIFCSIVFDFSASNNKYEKVYVYNYTGISYLAGLSFKY